MKKVLMVLMVLSISLFLFSCGPSACKCDNYLNGRDYGYGGRDTDLMLKCNDKYRSKIPKSYVGTNKFSEEVRRLAKEDCGK